MLSRQVGPLVVLVGLACLVAPASPAGATAAATKLCAYRQHQAVTSKRGTHYDVVNDNFGGRPECVINRWKRPNFTVTSSRANSSGPEVMAYPFALYGCSWGLCSRGSRLPARLSSIRGAHASWSTAGKAPGRWNAAFDVWFGRRRTAQNRQARGAELMVWLNAHDYPAIRSRVIRVDHRRWYFLHWTAAHDGAHWNYIQVRAVRPTRQVRHLSLLPIIRRVEKMGLIRPRWWLLNIESGFEIWRGGQGLRTRWFSAAVR
jgi:hypothetical protein